MMKLSYQIMLILISIILLLAVFYLKVFLIKSAKIKINEIDLKEIGVHPVSECKTENYKDKQSSLKEYSFCNYTVNQLNNTWIFIELKKFSNKKDLYSFYEYDSQHLFAIDGILSENRYGDKSRFRINSENDYGAEFSNPNIFYYHLWICKDDYLIHITSKGSDQASIYIEKIAEFVLSKF